MQFNVSQLLKESIGATRQYPVNEEFPPLAETQAHHAKGNIRMVRTDRGIWLTGALDVQAVSTCSRCLQEFAHLIHFELDEEYVPTIDLVTGVRLPMPEESDGALAIDEHHTLDLTEAVRQYTLTHLPMKPLCRADCQGICQDCGVNLNDVRCQCDRAPLDRKWAPLMELLETKEHQ